MSIDTTQYAVPHLEEHFSQYTLHWNHPVQTDTPDLLGAFQQAQDRVELMKAARAQFDEDAELAEADMPAGYETLTD